MYNTAQTTATMAKSSLSLDKGKGKAKEPDQSVDIENPVKPSNKIKKPEKIKLRRIHVSGLPDISEQEAKDRFKSFGEVVGVDGLGKLDATGKPLRYAFLDIKTTKSKLSQCMNLLSGSVWKGSTLRIAEAKPTFMDRLEQERKQAVKQHNADPSSLKKDKKRKREDADEVSKESSGEPLTSKTKPGWKLDPKTQTPIFPVIMRPDHPLPPPVHAEPEAGPSETKKDDKAAKASKKAEKAAKKAEKVARKSNKHKVADQEVSLSPPTRARMMKIDPTQWQAKHLREAELDNLPDTSSVKSRSVKNTSSSREAKGKKGMQLAEIQPPPEASSSEDDSADSDSNGKSIQPTAMKSAPVTKASVAATKSMEAVYDEEASLAERKANLDMVAKLLGGLPKDLEPVEEAIMVQADESDTDEESDSEESESSAEDEEEEEEKESLQGDQMSDEALGEEQDDQSNSEAEVTEHSQDETLNSTKLSGSSLNHNLADKKEVTFPASEPTEDQSMLANSSAQSSESEDEIDPDETGVTAHKSNALAEVQMQSLTDMFKPQEAAAGFTIGDLLDDFEVDELETITPAQRDGDTAANQSYQTMRSGWSAPTSAVPPQRAEASTNTLFFPFPLEEDEMPGGILYDMNEQDRERLLARSWTGTSTVRRFKRTQTIEDITNHYESVRRPISEQVRKRHREAVKRQKRHGGKRSMQGAVDEV